MKKRILLILLAVLTGLLLCGCRAVEGADERSLPETDQVRWVKFEPKEYVLRG